jgi:hypothetical protein
MQQRDADWRNQENTGDLRDSQGAGGGAAVAPQTA